MDCSQNFLNHGLQIARRCALRVGLNAADADDCAAAFVHKMLSDKLAPPSSDWVIQKSYLSRCALNHALDTRRRLIRRSHFENASDGSEVASDPAPMPEAALLRTEFWRVVALLLNDLPPDQKEAFLRYCFDGETSTEAAEAMNKTRNAADQLLHRARKRMIKTLDKHGLSEADLREYLC